MAQTQSEITKTETQKTVAHSTTASATPPAAATTPSRKKDKPKRSKRWKNVHKIEKGVTKSARRVSDAISDGINVWIERRDKSSRKKKDGDLRDLTKNLNKAVRKTVRKASKAPADVFDSVAKINIGGGKNRVGKTLFR
jgi:hypothetical protein